MRTKTVNIYTIEELPEEAQETAHQNWLESGDWFTWWPEWQDSLNAFCQIAPIEWLRTDVTAGHIDARFTDDDIAGLSGIRAWKWLQNNGWLDLAKRNAEGECTLTGYMGDCPLFDPIHALRDKPAKVPDLEQLFYECLQAWVYACRQDQEYQASFESFKEMAQANEWEFDEYGHMV